MKPDIKTRADVELLLEEFYKIAITDQEIGHHFDDLDLVSHLPLIVDFWEKVLFGKPVYFGNPVVIHQIINKKSPLTKEHFDRWLEIFTATIDALFAGETAEKAKEKAAVIAASLLARLTENESPNFIAIQNK